MKVLDVLAMFLGVLLAPTVSDRPIKVVAVAASLCKATGDIRTMMATVSSESR